MLAIRAGFLYSFSVESGNGSGAFGFCRGTRSYFSESACGRTCSSSSRNAVSFSSALTINLLPGAAVCIDAVNRSPLSVDLLGATPRPAALAQIIRDDFPVFHRSPCPRNESIRRCCTLTIDCRSSIEDLSKSRSLFVVGALPVVL